MRKTVSAGRTGAGATDHTRRTRRARQTATAACSALLSVGVLYVLYRIGEQFDDDDWMLLSCSGREPDEDTP